MEIMLNYNRFLRFNNGQIGIPRRFSIQPDISAASSSLAYWEKKVLQRPEICLMASLKSRVSATRANRLLQLYALAAQSLAPASVEDGAAFLLQRDWCSLGVDPGG